MTEKLLQFIWQFRYYDRQDLLTCDGEPLKILQPGRINSNQGPDFLNAKIQIGKTTWAGHIELHRKTSDWARHQHEKDRNYQNIILHVVWENDVRVNKIPVLELKGRVPGLLLNRYEQLMHSTSFIPCEKHPAPVKELTWKSWMDRLLAERLSRKAGIIETLLKETHYHWEETCWLVLAKSFGTKLNGEAFEAIARSLPLKLISKHKNNILQLEALLFGQAGLLDQDFREDYPKLLQREYRFLQRKYALSGIQHSLYFLRMRPAGFPSVRLAQLGALINRSSHLFSKIKSAVSVRELQALLTITPHDYWHYHYRFDDPSRFKAKKTGNQMTRFILINAICPLLFAYGTSQKDQGFLTRVIGFLDQLPAEKNRVTKGFSVLGTESRTALDSQALIELKQAYCDERKCLDCPVGKTLLNARG